ncbi:kinase-like protein [Nadsonia fulvescens var. elongata DSM 6958]|uniref:Kinase-like protein n=1 Tax=Nadsonia fulvescens var. elongata DSM 6958 TaxID=857566 RepID=A0A1E3PNJ8_9ASCO|nr:kinase-like protein [Nadsonia fulvescens var. elongata DSM 6958]
MATIFNFDDDDDLFQDDKGRRVTPATESHLTQQPQNFELLELASDPQNDTHADSEPTYIKDFSSIRISVNQNGETVACIDEDEYLEEAVDTVGELKLNTSKFENEVDNNNLKGSSIGSNNIPIVKARPRSGSLGRLGTSYEVDIDETYISSLAKEQCNFNMNNYESVIAQDINNYRDNISDPADSSLSLRKMVPNDFEPIKVLGTGTYGKVLLVREKATGRLYAQKQLKKASMVVATKTLENTKTERAILESVRHPYIVKLFYALQDHDKLYLILEYAQGGELFHHLEDQHMMPESTVSFYVAEMILALYHLHTNVGVVYRDLKPENCLLDSDGHLVLTDFGLSKVAADGESCNSILGTPEFMAPEVLAGLEYDSAVDWWSLGCVTHDLLIGHPPFIGRDHDKLLKKINASKKIDFPYYLSADAKDFLSKLLRKDPSKRIGDKDIEKIKKCRFFRKINWKKLETRDPNLVPPIVPVITDPVKAENFSREFTDMPLSPGGNFDFLTSDTDGLLIPDVNSGNKAENPFLGFSFTASKSFIDSKYK